MVIYPMTRTGRKLFPLVIYGSLLALAGACLLTSGGCSLAQWEAFATAADPVAAETQRQAVQDAAAGEEWGISDLLETLAMAGGALLGIGGVSAGGYATGRKLIRGSVGPPK